MKKRIQFRILAAALIIVTVIVATAIRSFRSAESDLVQEEPSTVSGSESKPVSITPELSLMERKTLLIQLDKKEAREWIVSELDKGTDFETGKDLMIAADQNLDSWPSYRVYLLDMLFLIDPALAAQRSRDLVESGGSADEWAVALRNVAKADTDGTDTAWLQEKVRELVQNRSWRADPSAGYLNAFDVIVHTRHTEVSTELLRLCEDRDKKAVRHAAFLALDRLVQLSPHEMLPQLAETAGQYPEGGAMISNLMARADIRDVQQRDALEVYLLSKDRTKEDLRGFANVFPNANFHVSNNLITKVDSVDAADLAERDYVSLAVIRAWLTDKRFVALYPELEKVQARLKTFVKVRGALPDGQP